MGRWLPRPRATSSEEGPGVGTWEEQREGPYMVHGSRGFEMRCSPGTEQCRPRGGAEEGFEGLIRRTHIA